MKSLIYTLLLIVSVQCFSQEKPSFKKIEYVSYEDDNGKIKTDSYFVIDNYGNVNIQVKLYKGIEYSKLQLNKKEIAMLNQLFNDSTTLKNYVETNKLSAGDHYAGNYSYLSFTSLDNKIQRLVYISPFMDKDFNDMMEKITHDIIWNPGKEVVSKPSYNLDATEKEISKINKKANLPKKELPPPMGN